jgi:EF hand
MRQFWTGALAALALSGGGVMLWQVQANRAVTLPEGRPPPVEGEAPLADEPLELPMPDANAIKRGPALPTAGEPPEKAKATAEQKRFARFDRDRDGEITRVEMLSTRTSAFRKLDKNGDNLLTFEEWAVATSDRFGGADKNRNGILSRDEFATTKPKEAKKPACQC